MLTNALQAAPAFMIPESEARKIIDDQVEVIVESWPRVSEEAGMTPEEALYFENGQILPRYAFDGYGPCPDFRPEQRESMPSPDPF